METVQNAGIDPYLMSRKIEITANGEILTIAENTSLPAFLETRGQAPERVVVERNGEALTPGELEDIILQPGDRLEIVRIVAGG